MNGINYLTQFLNPRKNSPTADRRKSHLFTRIDQAYVNAGYMITSDDVTSFVVNEFIVDFYRVYDSLSNLPSNTRLYAQFSPNSINYYFQKEIDGVFKYATLQNILKRNDDDHFFEALDDTFFTHIGFYDRLFYNTEEKVLYTASETIPEITITARRFLSYNPNKLGGLTNRVYSLQYKDASGYSDGIVSRTLNKYTGDIFASSSEKREVTLELNSKKGQLYWYPRVQIGTEKRITLYYDYNPRGNENSNVNGEDFAIKLEFHHPESFFAFMTLTYFANGISPLETSEGSGTRKADLFVNYVKIFEILMKQNEVNLTQKLAYLFYVHEDFFLKNQHLTSKLKGPDNILGIKFIWDTISSVLESNPNNTGVDSETILLKLLEILKIIQRDNKKANVERNDYILTELLYRETSNQESYFKAMYNNFDGDRFVLYNQFIYQLWVNSSYIDPRNPAYTDTSQLVGKNDIGEDKPQLILPYKTNKLLGFYTSNMDIDFDEKENIVVKPDDSSIDNIAGFFDPELGKALDNLIEEDWINVYHPLQPVYLMDPGNDKAFSLHKISPMILLKANEDESFWSNVATATEYAFDIVTTASGVGNLAKFRHLGRVIKAAKATGKSRKVILSYQVSRAVSGANAFAEITSGTINTLLKITGIEDTEFGKSLSEFLFWIELASLSVDITDAAKKGIKKNAHILTGSKSKVLEHHLDDLIKKGEINLSVKNLVLRELEKITGVVQNFIKALPKKIASIIETLPKSIQLRVRNKLLEFEYKGNIFARMNSKGVLVHLDTFKQIPKKSKITELTDLKIHLEVKNELNQLITKKYVDTIEVYKDYKGDIYFSNKFEEGKIRDADYINYTHVKNKKDPPYMTNPKEFSDVKDSFLEKGDTFYMVEFIDQAYPGGFGTDKPISTVKELREKLSVIKDWKDEDQGILVIKKYTIIAEELKLKMREGYIGPMLETSKSSPNFGKTYPGGAYQYEFLDNWRDYEDISKVIELDKAFTKKLK